MFDVAWYVPAQIMNLSAIALVFALSCMVLLRMPQPYFRWWVASSGVSALGSALGAAVLMLEGLKALSPLITITMIVSSTMLIGSARRYRNLSVALPCKWWCSALLIAVTVGMTAWGFEMITAMLPGFFALFISNVYFGVSYWPRAGEARGLGAYMVAGSAVGWGLHILTFPLFWHFTPALFPLGYWVSAMLHFGLGMGMVLHLYEQSNDREQQLARQLSQTNHELLRTVTALTETRSQAELSAAVAREQEALVRQIIHDLRNSTQAISLITEDLDEAVADHSGAQRALAALDRQVRFISNFLKEKLAWIVDRESIPADGTALAPAFDALGAAMEPLMSAKRQTLAIDGPPPVKLPISPVQFHQLLLNLLMNAHGHCPEGTRVRLWTAVSDGWATFYVADDGPGIPLALQGDLGRTSPRQDGTGVGLRNVHDLVTTAGGLFGVVSEPGKGSTFYITLPLVTWGLTAPGEPLPAVPSHVNEPAGRV